MRLTCPGKGSRTFRTRLQSAPRITCSREGDGRPRCRSGRGAPRSEHPRQCERQRLRQDILRQRGRLGIGAVTRRSSAWPGAAEARRLGALSARADRRRSRPPSVWRSNRRSPSTDEQLLGLVRTGLHASEGGQRPRRTRSTLDCTRSPITTRTSASAYAAEPAARRAQPAMRCGSTTRSGTRIPGISAQLGMAEITDRYRQAQAGLGSTCSPRCGSGRSMAWSALADRLDLLAHGVCRRTPVEELLDVLRADAERMDAFSRTAPGIARRACWRRCLRERGCGAAALLRGGAASDSAPAPPLPAPADPIRQMSRRSSRRAANGVGDPVSRRREQPGSGSLEGAVLRAVDGSKWRSPRHAEAVRGVDSCAHMVRVGYLRLRRSRGERKALLRYHAAWCTGSDDPNPLAGSAG